MKNSKISLLARLTCLITVLVVTQRISLECSVAEGFGEIETITTGARSQIDNFFPSAASSGHGVSIIAWTTNSGSLLAAEKVGSGAWTVVTIGSSSGNRPASVALNKSGAAIVAGCNSSALRLRYRAADGTWASSVSRFLSNCPMTSAAINSSGRAVVVYAHQLTSYVTYPYGIVALVQNTDGSWPTNPIVVKELPNYLSGGPHVSAAIDDQGNVLAVWDFVRPPSTTIPFRPFINVVSYATISAGSSSASTSSDMTQEPDFVDGVGPIVAYDSASNKALLGFGKDTGYNTNTNFKVFTGSISSGGFIPSFTDSHRMGPTLPFLSVSERGSLIYGWTTYDVSVNNFKSSIYQISGTGVGFSVEKNATPVADNPLISSSPRVVETRSGSVFGAYAFQNLVSGTSEGKFIRYNSGGSELASSTIFPVSGNDPDLRGINLMASNYDEAIAVVFNGTSIFAQTYQGDATEGGGGSDDLCPSDANKTEPGTCGCGSPESDSNHDKIVDCGSPKTFTKSAKPTIVSTTGGKGKFTVLFEKFAGKGLTYEVTITGPKKFKSVVVSSKNSVTLKKLAKGKYQVKVKVIQKQNKKTSSSKSSSSSNVTVT